MKNSRRGKYGEASTQGGVSHFYQKTVHVLKIIFKTKR